MTISLPVLCSEGQMYMQGLSTKFFCTDQLWEEIYYEFLFLVCVHYAHETPGRFCS
jgi:hypothetical protein